MRAACPSDAPSLLLALESVAREGLIGAEPGERGLGQTVWLINQHAAQRALMLVALNGARVGGACGLTPGFFRRSAHVLDLGMFVLPPWRGSGLATGLLHAALAWARDQGCCKVTLGVLASNLRAIGFYEKMGFTREGVRRSQFTMEGGFEDETLMARFLSW
ncbi:MAG: GNAT family N-acetyltransferase [Pseudomonadota bacterium]